jgi:hypothetical protein
MGSLYGEKLIAEKQEYVRSVSEDCGGELWNEKEVLESESCDCNVATELGEVVLVGLATVRPQARNAGLLVVPRPIRRTELHGREDVNQSRMGASLGQDLPDAVLLAKSLRPLDVLDLDPFLAARRSALAEWLRGTAARTV